MYHNLPVTIESLKAYLEKAYPVTCETETRTPGEGGPDTLILHTGAFDVHSVKKLRLSLRNVLGHCCLQLSGRLRVIRLNHLKEGVLARAVNALNPALFSDAPGSQMTASEKGRVRITLCVPISSADDIDHVLTRVFALFFKYRITLLEKIQLISDTPVYAAFRGAAARPPRRKSPLSFNSPFGRIFTEDGNHPAPNDDGWTPDSFDDLITDDLFTDDPAQEGPSEDLPDEDDDCILPVPFRPFIRPEEPKDDEDEGGSHDENEF